MEEVYNSYPDIEPNVGIEKLQGKDMLLFCSRNDKLIDIENTYEFVNRAHEAGLKLDVKIGHGNHIPFCYKVLKDDKRWREFLK